MTTVWIYGLFDPREPDRIRYVGQSSNPRSRLRAHCCAGSGNPELQAWVDALKSERVMPAMRLFQTSDEGMAGLLEDEWIAHFWCPSLLNARKKYGQMMNRCDLTSSGSLPLPGETELYYVVPCFWGDVLKSFPDELAAQLPDSLVLTILDAEREFQARRKD